jgi:GTP-binding protein Era
LSFKSGFVSIVGSPNAGKSTLLNALLDEKIAAVSPKPQTTRTRIMGVVTDESAQIILLDTPGIHKPKNKLGKYMESVTQQTVGEADVLLYIVDASKYSLQREAEILQGISSPIVFLLLNKTDKVAKADLLPIISDFSKIMKFSEIIPISAQEKEGIDELMQCIKKYMQEGPKFFPDNTLTDQPERQICSELIREKMMRLLDDEIPYGTAVVIEKMSYDSAKDITNISGVIYCERESHKAIIIGKGGLMLKKIGTAARVDLQRFVGTKVFLQLWVKVLENWRNSSRNLSNFGFKE